MKAPLEKAMLISAALVVIATLSHCQHVRQLDDLGDREEMRRDIERMQTEFYFPNPCPTTPKNQ